MSVASSPEPVACHPRGSHPDPCLDPARERVLELLRVHGRQSTSFQTLNPDLEYLFHDDGEAYGFVAYKRIHRAWVSAGEPVGNPGFAAASARRFVAAARAESVRPRLFGVGRELADRAGLDRLFIGEEPVYDARGFGTRAKRSLREQFRRARAKGVGVRWSKGLGDDDRMALRSLVSAWLLGRKMAPMGFMVRVEPAYLSEERLFFLAERNGEMVGAAVVSPVYARPAYFVEHIVRRPDAPNGTSELLVESVMRHAAGTDRPEVSLGLAPLSGDGVPPALSLVARTSRRFYDFEGLRSFKAKLGPARWEPRYVAFPRGEMPVRAIYDVLAAFAEGDPIRFAWASLAGR